MCVCIKSVQERRYDSISAIYHLLVNDSNKSASKTDCSANNAETLMDTSSAGTHDDGGSSSQLHLSIQVLLFNDFHYRYK